MKKYFKIAIAWGLFLGFLGICFHPSTSFFPESNFRLSSDSRLPKWFTIPSGYSRKDVNVEIFYYAPPPFIRSNLKVVLIGPPPEKKILVKKIGEVRDHPNYSNDRFQYPTYNIAVVDGIREIIEHRQEGPIFYISDNPKLKQ